MLLRTGETRPATPIAAPRFHVNFSAHPAAGADVCARRSDFPFCPARRDASSTADGRHDARTLRQLQSTPRSIAQYPVAVPSRLPCRILLIRPYPTVDGGHVFDHPVQPLGRTLFTRMRIRWPITRAPRNSPAPLGERGTRTCSTHMVE